MVIVIFLHQIQKSLKTTIILSLINAVQTHISRKNITLTMSDFFMKWGVDTYNHEINFNNSQHRLSADYQLYVNLLEELLYKFEYLIIQLNKKPTDDYLQKYLLGLKINTTRILYDFSK